MADPSNKTTKYGISRRELLVGLGILVVGAHLPGAPALASPVGFEIDPTNKNLAFNAFVGVSSAGVITVLLPVVEMGQGVSTALPQCVADELDADWEQVRVIHAPEDRAYRATIAAPISMQVTGGSSSIRVWRDPMRKAGARARAQLIAAAAERWGVAASECTTAKSVVSHPSGKSATYGSLAEAAARMRAPNKVGLKPKSEWTLIGKPIARKDSREKVDGTGVFGVDVRLPNMVRACVVACPVFGGRVQSVDDSAARAITGVIDVLVFDTYVAVVAKTWWPANLGAKALSITWDEGDNAALSSADISAMLHNALDGKKAAKGQGSGAAIGDLDNADDVLDVRYEVPLLEHATMEPMNATARVTADRCEVWAGMQAHTRTMREIRALTGLKPDQIHLNTTLLGGGFGRRGVSDYVLQAVEIAGKLDMPVQLIWTREETMQHGQYRPAFAARLRASTGDGQLTAMHLQVAGPNLLHPNLPGLLYGLGPVRRFPMEGMTVESPYHFDRARIDWAQVDYPVPTSFWRSVGHSHNGFFLECAVDEIAHRLGQDPLAYRRSLIREHPRFLAVLDRAAAEAGWGKAADGRHQGIAIMESYGSICAEVVEISMKGGRPRIHRVTAAVDCGPVVNPDIVRAQIMGGAIFGLSAALGGRITLADGRVEQNNFHDYRLLRMGEAPQVDVHIIDSTSEAIGGIGEVATPPAAPALANALFAATGRRLRTLPLLDALDAS